MLGCAEEALCGSRCLSLTQQSRKSSWREAWLRGGCPSSAECRECAGSQCNHLGQLLSACLFSCHLVSPGTDAWGTAWPRLTPSEEGPVYLSIQVFLNADVLLQAPSTRREARHFSCGTMRGRWQSLCLYRCPLWRQTYCPSGRGLCGNLRFGSQWVRTTPT